jgi:hypothetical protein
MFELSQRDFLIDHWKKLINLDEQIDPAILDVRINITLSVGNLARSGTF